MRDGKERRVKQGRSADEASKRVGASESATSPLKRRAAEIGDEGALIRLIQIIARQAAQEAFAVFKNALDGRAAGDRPLPDPSNLEHSPEAHAGKESAPHEPVEQFLSVAEAAKRLDVSQKTVRRKIASDDLPAHQVGKLIRVSERILAAYVARAQSRKS
jgi:excisionase family DNA binding protein